MFVEKELDQRFHEQEFDAFRLEVNERLKRLEEHALPHYHR